MSWVIQFYQVCSAGFILRVCIMFISKIDKIKIKEFQLFFLPLIAFMRINLWRIKSKCANTSTCGLIELVHAATILHKKKTFCTGVLPRSEITLYLKPFFDMSYTIISQSNSTVSIFFIQSIFLFLSLLPLSN